MEHSFLNNLTWRQAVKKFDSARKLTNEQLQQILQAIKYAPSSYGLQTVHVLVITDNDLRSKLQPATNNQTQVIDCSHLLVFCARTDVNERLNKYLQIGENLKIWNTNQLNDRRQYLITSLNKKSDSDMLNWASRQTYIALGFALAAAAELKIDACPMEGFDSVSYHKILRLPDYLQPTALVALGFRSAEERTRPKLRFPDSDLFTKI